MHNIVNAYAGMMGLGIIKSSIWCPCGEDRLIRSSRRYMLLLLISWLSQTLVNRCIRPIPFIEGDADVVTVIIGQITEIKEVQLKIQNSTNKSKRAV